jgi:sulfonate transport system ATP-binding protein
MTLTESLFSGRVSATKSFDQPAAKASTGVEATISSSNRRPENGLGINIRRVTRDFGPNQVLKGIDLDVVPGEFLAIVGKSGCGKSTLLRLIAGLDATSTGQIRVGGAVHDGQPPETRLMFQDARLLPWRRVIDNVGIGRTGNWRDEANAVLHHVGLDGRAKDWPSVLSGGQRQRVALARALMSKPKLMLLDEPLGALDALTRLEMQTLVEQVWREQGFTAILVTHDVGEAVALADRVVVLEEGLVGNIWTVDAPRPRRRGDKYLAEIEADILDRLMRRPPVETPEFSI